MPKAIVISALLASSMAFTGCSEGGGGSGGSGASGGSAALSFDAETALPATSAAATAMAFSATLGTTFGAVLAAVDPDLLPAAPSVTPKVDLPVNGA